MLHNLEIFERVLRENIGSRIHLDVKATLTPMPMQAPVLILHRTINISYVTTSMITTFWQGLMLRVTVSCLIGKHSISQFSLKNL
jgi:hypothetical protein